MRNARKHVKKKVACSAAEVSISTTALFYWHMLSQRATLQTDRKAAALPAGSVDSQGALKRMVRSF